MEKKMVMDSLSEKRKLQGITRQIKLDQAIEKGRLIIAGYILKAIIQDQLISAGK